MNSIPAKYIRTKKFSNKNFFIEIRLYEHGLARGHCVCKRRGVERKMQKNSVPCLYFPSYGWVTIMEYNEFYGCFAGDKIARRWVRKVMQHSLKGFLHTNGEIDHTKFAIEHDRRNCTSREYYRLNATQLLTIKRLVPDFFYPGTFRTEVSKYCRNVLEYSSKEEYKSESPKILNHPIGYRKYLQGRAGHRKKYMPVATLKAFLKEFDSEFYALVCEERTIDDCNMWVEYHFLKGEKPEMRIFVQDNNFIDYYLPNE